MTSVEKTVLTLVNAERADAGCAALTAQRQLTKAAGDHATDMVKKGYFSHTSPAGSTPSSRAKAAGYPGGAGENIALGYATAKAAVQGWMSSPGHRENILNCAYTVTGIGYDPGTVLKGYSPGSWVQMFGSS